MDPVRTPVIYMASLIHILWGILLVMMPDLAPRPFGSLEPYFELLTPREVGFSFLVAAAFASFSRLIGGSRWWMGPLMTTPQQMIIVFGFLGAFPNLFVSHTGEEALSFVMRTLYSMVYVLAILIFHTIDVYLYWNRAYAEWVAGWNVRTGSR